jgi:hypothetical protein
MREGGILGSGRLLMSVSDEKVRRWKKRTGKTGAGGQRVLLNLVLLVGRVCYE